MVHQARRPARLVIATVAAVGASMLTAVSARAATGAAWAAHAPASAGVWGTAREVPGSGTLNRGGNAAIDSVSCASAGNCSAGGSYRSVSSQEAFVVSKT